MHVTALGNDYYHYDPTRHWLIGERSNRIFRLGDPVDVKVVHVNLDDRKIDFELNEKPGHKTPTGKSRKDKTKGRGKDKDKSGRNSEARSGDKKKDKGARGNRRKTGSKGKVARKSKAKKETRRTRSPRRKSR